jgi:hypothetical protein
MKENERRKQRRVDNKKEMEQHTEKQKILLKKRKRVSINNGKVKGANDHQTRR